MTSFTASQKELIRFIVTRPGSVALAFIAVALSSAAATMSLGAVDALYFKELSLAQPEQLVVMQWEAPSRPDRRIMRTYAGYGSTQLGSSFPVQTLDVVRSEGSPLTAAFLYVPFGYGPDGATTQVSGAPLPITAVSVTTPFFTALGLRPALGRVFDENDDPLQWALSEPVVVISHSYWQQRFASRSEAVGSLLTINDESYRVVGVAPSGFTGLEPGVPTDAWVPLGNSSKRTVWGGPSVWLMDNTRWTAVIFGRVKPGLSPQAAEAGLNVLIKASLEADGASLDPLFRVRLKSAARGISDFRETLGASVLTGALFAGAFLVLAYSALFALWHQRFHESARTLRVQLTLGMPFRLAARNAVLESASFCGAASVVGFLVGALILRFAEPLVSQVVREWGFRLDPTPVGWRLALFSALVFVGGMAATTMTQLLRYRRAASATQFVAARTGRAPLPRLAGGVVESLGATGLVVVVGVSVAVGISALYQYHRASATAVPELEIAHIRGVESGRVSEGLIRELAETVDLLASGGSRAVTFFSEPLFAESRLRAEISVGDSKSEVALNLVGPRFAGTLGVPLLYGRDIQDFDQRRNSLVAVLDEQVARHFGPGPSAIGQTVNLAAFGGQFLVVGIVRAGLLGDLRRPPAPTVFIPLADGRGLPAISSLFVAANIEQDIGPQSAIETSIRSACPRCQLVSVSSGKQKVQSALSRELLESSVAVVAAVVSTSITAVTFISTLLGSLRRRAAEFALRQAVGASRSALMYLITAGISRALWLPLSVGWVATQLCIHYLRDSSIVANAVSPSWCATVGGGALVAIAAIGTTMALGVLRSQNLNILLRQQP